MPIFYWNGINAAGKSISGSRQATDIEELKNQLLSKQIALLSAKTQSNIIFKINNFLLSQKLSVYEFVNFFEQLAVLIDGGVELLTALHTISNQSQNYKIKNIVESIKTEVERGNSLSVALGKNPEIFEEFIIQMIVVGEVSGKLPQVLTELADYLKKNYELRRDLLNSAAVPIFTLVFAFAIIVVIFVGVVPQFQTFFDSLGKKIPASTQRLITISNFLRSRMALFGIIGFAGCVALLFLFFGKTKMKKLTDSILLRCPFFNRLIALSSMTSFLQTLNLLLRSGIPLSQAVLTAKSSVKNFYIQEKISQIVDQLAIGKSFTDSLDSLRGLYKYDMLASLVRVGEQASNLDIVLEKASQFFSSELKRMIVSITSFFQPVLLLIIGLIVGILVWIIYLPIINLAYSLN